MAGQNLAAISVIGAGYVGLTTAVLLAEAGHKVYAIDINPERLAIISESRSFFYENGLNPLIKHAIQAKNLIPTGSYDESISASSVIFSCVGTPNNPDGSSNLSFVYKAAEEAVKRMRPGAIFVQKSTVPVGTGKVIEDRFGFEHKQIYYVSNPEFLREGAAIADSLWPDRIVVGSSHRQASQKVLDIYRSLELSRGKIAKRAGVGPAKEPSDSHFITNRNSAELIKVTANAFLALKISFANSIAKLADHTGADINEVMDGIGKDKRIGRAFLNAGRGYGGGCFPKDVSGLISSAYEHGVDLQIMTAASDLNDSMPGYIASKAQAKMKSLSSKHVAVLGLAFKPGTSDTRRSPGVKLANALAHSSATVTAYDPQANEEAKPELRRGIKLCDSLEDSIKGADAVFVATDWPEFISMDFTAAKDLMSGDLIVDCMNALDEKAVTKAGLTYMGVGRY